MSEDQEEYGIPEELRIKRRPYTLSEAALAQRRAASSSPAHAESMKGNRNAWKTGEHAQGFIRQIFRPCKSTCPQYPCNLIEDGDTRPGSECLDKAEVVRNIAAVQRAIKNGDLDDFKDIVAVRLGSILDILAKLQEDIHRDGTMIKSQKWGKDGKLLGYEIKPHPSFLAIGDLYKVLNVSPSDMMITPKEIKKNNADEKTSETLATLMSKVARNVSKNENPESDV